MADKKLVALDLVSRSLEAQSIRLLVLEAYQKLIEEFAPELLIQPQRIDGEIYSYMVGDGFGFLRDDYGSEYYYHISEVREKYLGLELQDLKSIVSLPVTFKLALVNMGEYSYGWPLSDCT